jgi:sugar phosphate permease
MAWWGTSYVLGGFLATAFATFMITNTVILPQLGWRRGMFGPALILLLAAIFFGWQVRDDPRDVGLSLRGTDPPVVGEKVTASSARNAWKRLLRNPDLQAIAVMYFLLKLARYSFLFWLPLYFSQRLHYSDQQAGYTSSLFELIGVVGPLVAGYASDRLLASRRYPVAAVMLWALGALCLVQPVANIAGFWGTAAAISIIGVLVYGPDSLMSVAAVQDLACGAETARALGFVDGVGSCGQLVSAYVVALFVSSFGWDYTFTLFAVLSVVAGVVLALRWGPEKRARKREATALAIPLPNMAQAED